MHHYINQLVILLFTITSFCFGEEYIISIGCAEKSYQNKTSWECTKANSSIKIDNLYMDVFQWTIASNNKESLSIEIMDPVWEFSSYNKNNIQFPETISLSKIKNYRNTPVVYVRILPWRENGNSIEVLKSGKLKLSLPIPNFPITFSSPSLINKQNKLLNRNENDKTEYLIITPERFFAQATSLAEMHSNEVNIPLQLKTEVVTTSEISSNITGMKIREYIIERINSDLRNDGFLLLFGDENDIPPIYDYYGNYPSDDFYSTDSANLYSGKAQLKSGRIPVKKQNDATKIIEKIRSYTLELEPGIWRSQVALVADDNYRRCSQDLYESIHTKNSDVIFDSLTNLLPITPFYGVNYNIKLKSDGCEYPSLTDDLIRAINNGFALINYTGHGDPETWADENILSKNRDINLINSKDNRLAIWIAGTCSFGKYNNEDSFMESLLIKKNGAIAIIASTDAIGYTPNKEFIESLFGISNDHGIQDIVNNHSQYYYKGKIRLSELVHNSKNNIDNFNDYYKFHTFGDPALTLPFPTVSEGIINQPLESIMLIQEQTLDLNNKDLQSTILIKENDKNIMLNGSNTSYSIPGQTYTHMKSDSNITCFRVPLDASSCFNCRAKLFIYQDNYQEDGNIQIIKNIKIEDSNQSAVDLVGPEINIFQNDKKISLGSILLPELDLTVELNDSSGINLMNTIGHGIRYSFNENTIKLINGSEFIYQTCSKGIINIPTSSINNDEINSIYLEAWDGLNNRSTININLSTNNIFHEQFSISKVFPFPNPFKNSTNFTMFCSSFPVDIKIEVFSLNGNFIKELTKFNTEDFFISIPWNGKDRLGRTIANGTYFYHIEANNNGEIIYENIFKVSKIQ